MQVKKIVLLALLVLISLSQSVLAAVKTKKFSTPSAYLIVEVLNDDAVHFELSGILPGPTASSPIYTSPMIFKTDYPGPSSFSDQGSALETTHLRVEVNPSNLCTAIKDKTTGNAYLTTICPQDLNAAMKGIDIDPGQMQNVYGLGQQFKSLGRSDGDWVAHGVREGEGTLGNGFMGFDAGAVGNVQIPVMYAVGANNLNYLLMMDNVYKQKWDFSVSWWKARMYGDQLRFYVMTGKDLPALRAGYMELTGTPPVPPKKSFGLTISEFGYDNWNEVHPLLSGLRSNGFPVDGFVLDLNWFGGISLTDGSRSRMGRLNWDEDQNDGNGYFFPNPGQKIKDYAGDDIAVTVIEESYLADTRFVDTFSQISTALTAFQRTNGKCDATNRSSSAAVQGFWGQGHMIDWSNPDARKWIHDNRRYPNLAKIGVTAHWTDLGEPESYNGSACYNGVETTASGIKNEHSDIHNLYNLLWNKGIWDGYFDKRGQANDLGVVNPRPFILARSAAAGIQRYGVAMWSGDIPSDLQALSTHHNAQLHMSFSGIDYYGSDAGGFRREKLPSNDKYGSYRGYDSENFTQWYANSSWFDIPLRPHTDNEFITARPPYSTAPHLVGKKESNLFNTRQRYELIPYYYSLAYRAYLFGEPVIPPPVLYYQNDPKVRQMGHEKLLGKDLLVGIVSRYGEYERDVYLPTGTWVNYHTNEWVTSTGQAVTNVPVYRKGILTLPAFARAGAIIPQMYVDENNKDAFGHRNNNAPAHNELIVKVFAAPILSTFTLYEDDGTTLGYTASGRPKYQYRTTEIRQQQVKNTATVTIRPASNVNWQLPLKVNRQNVVKLVVKDAEATAVKLNGSLLTRHNLERDFNAASNGWFNAGNNLILAKTGPMDIYKTTKTLTFSLRPLTKTTSVNFVCDNGFTRPGESVYVVGNIPALGGPNWRTDQAVKLEPSVYYDYIVTPPPPGGQNPGPSAPVWTGIISGLPSNTTFEWKCIRKHEDGSGVVEWQPGTNNTFTTNSSGFAGRSYGRF